MRFGEDTKESLLDLARRMLEVFHAKREPGVEVLAVDLDTGEILDRGLVGTLDLIERGSDGRIVVIDLKTSAYSDLQVEASPQLSVYSWRHAAAGE